ncbi:hypothetical protein YB2330_006476 [Saitoella coloradoensis]
MNNKEQAIHALLEYLGSKEYFFLTPTPETHALVDQKLRKNDDVTAKCLTDVFGWSMEFAMPLEDFPESLLLTLRDESLIQKKAENRYWSTIRVSTLYPPGPYLPSSSTPRRNLYTHSAFPTHDQSAVFFGPDTYRFLRFMTQAYKQFGHLLPKDPIPQAADVGTGGGAGAIHLRHLLGRYSRVYGLDLSPKAIELARINAGYIFPLNTTDPCAPDFAESDILSGLPRSYPPSHPYFVPGVDHKHDPGLDLLVCNPPYIASATQTYAAGGTAKSGLDLPLRILGEALGEKGVRVGGMVWFYTGVPVPIRGGRKDMFYEEVEKMRVSASATSEESSSQEQAASAPDGTEWKWEVLEYDVMDVDIFGCEMGTHEGPYKGIGRIQAVGCVLRKVKA